MADEITVVEHYTSGAENVGTIDGDSDLIFHAWGSLSSLAVREAVFAKAPETYHQLSKANMSLTPLGAGYWQAKVHYETLKNKVDISIDTTPEKIKKLRSIQTVSRHRVRDIAKLGTFAPDFKGLINVSNDKVEGVDVYASGRFSLTLAWTWATGAIRPDYIQTCTRMGATVNDTDVILNYKGQQLTYKRGELLFLGGAFHESNQDGFNISLKFEGNLTEKEIAVGERAGKNPDGTEPPEKKYDFLEKEGWHFLWITTIKTPDKDTKIPTEVPDCAYVEQVYQYSDFSKLEVFDIVKTYQTGTRSIKDLLVKEREKEESLFEGFQGFLSP
jgi:hypothetical protein